MDSNDLGEQHGVNEGLAVQIGIAKLAALLWVDYRAAESVCPHPGSGLFRGEADGGFELGMVLEKLRKGVSLGSDANHNVLHLLLIVRRQHHENGEGAEVPAGRLVARRTAVERLAVALAEKPLVLLGLQLNAARD